MWFFLTPIVYVKENLVREGKQLDWVWIFDINPMAHIVDLYRYVLVYPEEIRFTFVENQMIPVTTTDVLMKLGLLAVIATLTFLAGYNIFMAKKHKFADEI